MTKERTSGVQCSRLAREIDYLPHCPVWGDRMQFDLLKPALTLLGGAARTVQQEHFISGNPEQAPFQAAHYSPASERFPCAAFLRQRARSRSAPVLSPLQGGGAAFAQCRR
jgi:hypothetical protein